ncbi:TPA: hypothetical protein ACYRTT_004498, partial [Escherichia coli]|nr:hypothetical protein [Escherichia coli]
SWEYDAAGNLLDRRAGGGATAENSVVPFNRLMSYRGVHYRYDEFGRAVEKEGPQGTVVTVKSKQEAHDLLMEAFPDAQKVRGIGSQDAAGIRKKHKMEQFKKRDGTVRYRKDYPIDSNTGRVYGHDDPKGTGHGSLPHINIKRSDGTMVRIDIDG